MYYREYIILGITVIIMSYLLFYFSDLTDYNYANEDNNKNGSGFQNTSFNKGESEYASINQFPATVLSSSQISTSDSPPQSSPLPTSSCPAPPPQYEELNVITPYSEVTTLQRQLEAKHGNTATGSAAKNSNGDSSPTKRVTQVQVIGSSTNINSNDYQLPFEHHEYATLTESSATIKRPPADSRLTRSASPYVEPVPVPLSNGLSPYMEPVPSADNLHTISPYMEPVNSSSDIRGSSASPPVSPYEEPVNAVDDSTIPPHIEPLPSDDKRNQQNQQPLLDLFVIIDNPTNDSNGASSNINDITSPTPPAWYNSCYEDIVTPTAVENN